MCVCHVVRSHLGSGSYEFFSQGRERSFQPVDSSAWTVWLQKMERRMESGTWSLHRWKTCPFGPEKTVNACWNGKVLSIQGREWHSRRGGPCSCLGGGAGFGDSAKAFLCFLLAMRWSNLCFTGTFVTYYSVCVLERRGGEERERGWEKVRVSAMSHICPAAGPDQSPDLVLPHRCLNHHCCLWGCTSAESWIGSENGTKLFDMGCEHPKQLMV